MTATRLDKLADDYRARVEHDAEELLAQHRAAHGPDAPIVLVHDQLHIERCPWRGVVIHPRTDGKPGAQYTDFNPVGFWGHDYYSTWIKAVTDALWQGFTRYDPDLLETAIHSSEFTIPRVHRS